MPEGLPTNKVAEKLAEIRKNTDNFGDLALKLNALIAIREAEGDGKELNEFNKKTKAEMEPEYGKENFTDKEIFLLMQELEKLNHGEKHNYPRQ